MRLSYAEDEDFPGQFALWQGNCERSLRGKRGQASLRELEAALLALPVKELTINALETPEGAVCAVGALARHKGIDLKPYQEQLDELDKYEDYEMGEMMEAVGDACGVPPMVAWKIIELNDVRCEGQTAAQRFDTVLRWVQSRMLSGRETATP